MPEMVDHIEPAALYRLDLLPPVPAHQRRARIGKQLFLGQLVYYGPSPGFYGIGEIKRIVGRYVAVDFRGTGACRVHEDVIERDYVIPIPTATMSLL